MTDTYELAKSINVALLILAGLTLYLWARRLVTPAWALVAAGLALVIPQALYATLLLTENALFPAFLFGSFAIALALERPTFARQLLALAAIGLASSVRLQALILLPILVTALAVKAGLDLRARGQSTRRASLTASVKPFWPSAVLLALGAVAYLAATVARGSSLAGGFGAYESVLTADYSLSAAASWTRLHLADLALGVGVVPLSALLLLVWLAVSGRHVPDPAKRAFLAVGVAAVPWTLVEAGVFASRFTGWITERYTFYLLPLLLLALVVWLARGLPRPPLPTAIALLAPLALVQTFSVERYLGPFDLPNSLTLYALHRFTTDLPAGAPGIEWLVLGGAVVLALGFAFLPRRAAGALLPAALAAFFLSSSIPVFDGLRAQSVAVRAAAGPNPTWVDDYVADRGEAVFFFFFSRYSAEQRGGEIAIFVSRPWSGPRIPGVARITVGTLVVGPDGQPRIEKITATRTWEIGTTRGKLFVVPAPRAPFRIEVHVEPTFSPATYGLPDARQLGVKLGFRYLAGRSG